MTVYFIQAADGTVKIGKTNNMTRRFGALQTAHAHELKILRTIPGGMKEEWAAHFEFRDLRIRGEWFSYHEHMMSFVPKDLSKISLLRKPSGVARGAEPSLIDIVRGSIKHSSLKQKDIAKLMDYSPSDLSRKLAQSPNDSRRFTLDDLEKYVATTGDKQPILYLAEKFLSQPDVKELEAELARIQKRLDKATK